MDMELVNRARRDAAVRRCIAVAVNMAALSWDDEAKDAWTLMLGSTRTDADKAQPLMNEDDALDPTDVGTIAAAALFTAASDANSMLLALLRFALARIEKDQSANLRDELARLARAWQGDHLTVGRQGLMPDDQQRADALYREHLQRLLEQAIAAIHAVER